MDRWSVEVRVGVAWRSRSCESEGEAIRVYRDVSADLVQEVKGRRVVEGETILMRDGHAVVRFTMTNEQALS